MFISEREEGEEGEEREEGEEGEEGVLHAAAVAHVLCAAACAHMLHAAAVALCLVACCCWCTCVACDFCDLKDRIFVRFKIAPCSFVSTLFDRKLMQEKKEKKSKV